MPSATFVNREEELSALRERYQRDQADLVIIYGRRRMGKSALVRQSLQGIADAVVHQAVEVSPQLQLEQFTRDVVEVYPEAGELRPDWERLLAFLGSKGAVVVLDEFPYLVDTDPSLPSRIQRVWDHELEATSSTLVLIGSSISVMEDKILTGKSPLYGRRTATLDLGPLPVNHLDAFLPGLDGSQTVAAWSLFGGSPHALRALSPGEDLATNVYRTLVDEQGLLHDEPELLLRAELRQPNTYFSLLRAMAQGRTERNEVAQVAGVESNQVSSYLDRLRRLRLVEREVPATEDPARSRRGRYRIRDPLFRTWFRFIHGAQADLHRLGQDAYPELIEPHLADHASPVFETLCHQALPWLLPGPYRRIGRWWYREHEIDLAALRTDGAEVLGECKFTERSMHQGDLARLESTANEVQWPGTPPAERHLALFSRSGFDEPLQARAGEDPHLHLWTIEDVLAALGS